MTQTPDQPAPPGDPGRDPAAIVDALEADVLADSPATDAEPAPPEDQPAAEPPV